MLKGDRIVLRAIQAEDRERLYDLVESIEVRAMASNLPPLPLSLEEVEARDRRWLEERHDDSAWFAIDVDGEAIGVCGLHAIEHCRLREHAWYDGAWRDELVMAVLREDPAP